ncbi:MAG: TIGR02281 family clan AA aspartic protease [Alphaproteobacteria bacterium]
MSEGPWSGGDGPERGRRGLPWWVIIGFIAAVLFTVLFLVRRFPDAVADRDGQVHVVYYVLLATLMGSAWLVGMRIGLKAAFKNALAWIGIGLVLILGYSFRHDLGAIKDRVLGELLPHRAVVTDGGAISFRASAGGHFQIEARIDGTPIRFLVDTGATDIVLSPADARRLGFDPAKLRFDRSYRTANGIVQGAPVTLGELTVGPIRLNAIAATVNGAAMNQSLLGMRFLNHLKSYEVKDGVLTLYR